MHQEDVRSQIQATWAQTREKLLELFPDDADSLAVAELLMLRSLAAANLATHTMKNLQTPASRKKLTR